MEKEYDTSLQKEYKGRRITIICLDSVDNFKTKEILASFKELRNDLNLNFDIVFCHYGRPSKALAELTDWLRENKKLPETFLEKVADRMKRADDLLLTK